MKKAAVMLYPLFSLQEISCLTELFKFYDKEIVTFSAGREPVSSEDGNLVTAHGMAFREFAVKVARKVGIECPETIFSGMEGKKYTEEDFIFHFPPEDMEAVRADWARCLERARKHP